MYIVVVNENDSPKEIEIDLEEYWLGDADLTVDDIIETLFDGDSSGLRVVENDFNPSLMMYVDQDLESLVRLYGLIDHLVNQSGISESEAESVLYTIGADLNYMENKVMEEYLHIIFNKQGMVEWYCEINNVDSSIRHLLDTDKVIHEMKEQYGWSEVEDYERMYVYIGY